MMLSGGFDEFDNIIFRGETAGDQFGKDVAAADFTGNGLLDLIVGAPFAEVERSDGTIVTDGAVYIFYSPYQTDENGMLYARDADMRVESYFGDADERFGSRVAPLFDITGNGRPEIRTLSYADEDFIDFLGGEQITHIYDGETGEFLFAFVTSGGPDEFDPWQPFDGDVNGDGYVGQDDIDIIMANMGMSGPDVTRFDGDLNGDGVVDALDLAIAMDNFGFYQFEVEWGPNMEPIVMVPGGPGTTEPPPVWRIPVDTTPGCIGEEPGLCCGCCPSELCECCGDVPCQPVDLPEESDEGEFCVFQLETFCAPNCPVPDCQCDPGSWNWGATPADAVEWLSDTQGSCVDLKFRRPGEVAIYASNGCCTYNIAAEVYCCGVPNPNGGCEITVSVGGPPDEPGGSGPGDTGHVACVDDELEFFAEECNEYCEPDIEIWEADPPDAIAFVGPTGNIGQNVTVKFLQPGEVDLFVANGCCRGETTVEVTARPFLLMDFNNNNGFGIPWDDFGADPMVPPGKIVFTNIGDSDNDGIPDYADGYSHPQLGPEGATTSAQFTPLVWATDLGIDPADYIIQFEYSESNPNGVTVTVHGEQPFTWMEYTLPPVGHLRLWIVNGNQARSANPVSQGGHFIASGAAYNLASIPEMIFVEAVRPSLTPGGDTIKAILTHVPTGNSCEAELVLTAAEVEVYDIRKWEPIFDSGPRLVNANLWTPGDQFKVGGAIADGTSMCLVRIEPKMQLPWQPSQPVWQLKMKRRVDETIWDANRLVVGSLETVWDPDATEHFLPPVPFNSSDDAPSSSCTFEAMAFYIPPVSYIDQTHAIGGDHLANDEVTPMEFRIVRDQVVLGRAPFRLRRPPLVLVHGILSDPSTWPSDLYNESPGMNPLPTRMYRVNYQATHTKGYSENFPTLAKAINEALIQYRHGMDPASPLWSDPWNEHMRPFEEIKYAATRVDVIGHSMGGQLARAYASSLTGEYPRFGAWPPLDFSDRDELPPINWWEDNGEGRWPYLRADNYGAGDIRRLVTIGSPFKGSGQANAAAMIFEPTQDKIAALHEWATLGGSNPNQPNQPPMPDELKFKIFPNFPGGFYNIPTCIADLSVNSAAQELLSPLNVYPPWHYAVQWIPLAGRAAPTVGGAVWIALQSYLNSENSLELLSYFFGVIIDQEGFPTLAESLAAAVPSINPLSSDLVVPIPSQTNGAENAVLYDWHTHSPTSIDPDQLPGETHSPVIANHLRPLLSAPLSGIGLPAFPGFFPNSIDDTHFLPLGSGD